MSRRQSYVSFSISTPGALSILDIIQINNAAMIRRCFFYRHVWFNSTRREILCTCDANADGEKGREEKT